MKEKLIQAIKEALELDEEDVSLQNSLRDFDNWDSMSKLSLIALLDEHFEVQISNLEFDQIDTIQDLLGLIHEKLKQDGQANI